MAVTPPQDPIPSLKNALQHKQIHVRQRAKIVLLTLDGKAEDDIAEEVGVSKRTVAKWRNAWTQDGLWIFPREVFIDTMNASTTAPSKPETLDPETNGPDAPPSTPLPAQDAAPDPETPQLRVDIGFAADIKLQPDDTMAMAARKLLLRNMARLVEWEPIAREGTDPEGVHKMRVATRRLRSVLELFVRYIETTPYKNVNKRLRKTAKQLGNVRDLDVFMETVHRYVETELDGDDTALLPMLNELNKPYQKARKRLLHWLDDDKFDAFVQGFITTLQADDLEMVPELTGYTVGHTLPRLVYTYLEYVRMHDALLGDADLEMLHELRLDAKRLRYVLEFFDDVMGPEVKTVIDATKGLQDYLGALNDYRVANELAKDLQDELKGDARSAVKAFRSHCKAQIEAMRTGIGAAWAAFDTPQMRSALGRAIGAV